MNDNYGGKRIDARQAGSDIKARLLPGGLVYWVDRRAQAINVQYSLYAVFIMLYQGHLTSDVLVIKVAPCQ